DLERAYDNLSPEDKNCVKIEAEPFGNNVKFSGFCGNTECDYIGVAEFLVNKMNRFQKFVGVELNSHAPMVEIYSRMYSAYRPLKEKMISGMDVLSRESLIAILKEQIHPEHR
ncbi:MAG: YfbU family protein, partial [Selenomonadaceae bacterium]